MLNVVAFERHAAPEAAAARVVMYRDALRVDAADFCNTPPRLQRILHAGPDLCAPIRDAHGRAHRVHGRVIKIRHAVIGLDASRAFHEGGVDITNGMIVIAALGAQRLLLLVRPGCARERLMTGRPEARRQRRERRLGLPVGLGYDSHGLLEFDDALYTRASHSGRGFDRLEASAKHGCGHQRRMQHVRQPYINCVHGRTIDFRRHIEAVPRRTDNPVVRGRFERRTLRRLELYGRFDEFFVARASATRRMADA